MNYAGRISPAFCVENGVTYTFDFAQANPAFVTILKNHRINFLVVMSLLSVPTQNKTLQRPTSFSCLANSQRMSHHFFLPWFWNPWFSLQFPSFVLSSFQEWPPNWLGFELLPSSLFILLNFHLVDIRNSGYYRSVASGQTWVLTQCFEEEITYMFCAIRFRTEEYPVNFVYATNSPVCVFFFFFFLK